MENDASFALLSDGILRPALFLVGVLLLLSVMRKVSASLKHTILVTAFIVVLVFPLLVLRLPAFSPIPRTAPAFPEVVDSGKTDLDYIGSDSALRKTPVEDRFQVTKLLVTLWGVGSACLLVRLLISAISLRRRCGRQVEPGVFISGTTGAPLTYGVFHPKILLPTDAESWPADLHKTVLAHERTHVARRDALTGFLAEFVCALYWPNPLVWLAKARLVREREQACDDAVLTGGVSPAVYAKALVTVASGPVPTMTIGMADAKSVEERIRAIMNPLKRRRTSPRSSLLASVLILLVALPIAALQAKAPLAEPRFKTVVIDAGHGGQDAGGDGVEKDIALDLALGLEKRLKAEGIPVVMTRSDDRYIQLRDRVKIATESGADAIFVSLHCNSAGDTSQHGAEIFISAGSGEETSLGLENRLLANIVQRDLTTVEDMSDRGVKTARFLVIRSQRIPAVLVECGFVTNAEERARLESPVYRQKIVDGVAKGILAYRASR